MHDLPLLIALWMEHQVFDCGGPTFLFPALEKALDKTGYDWMGTSIRVISIPRFKCHRDEMVADFYHAVHKLKPQEQQELWAVIRSGYYNEPEYDRTEVEVGDAEALVKSEAPKVRPGTKAWWKSLGKEKRRELQAHYRKGLPAARKAFIEQYCRPNTTNN